MFLSNGTEHIRTIQETHVGNHIIRSVTTKWLGMADGETVDMLAAVPTMKEPKNTHYRQKDGFIETSLSDPEKDPLPTWESLVKVGAKAGDQWQNPNLSSVTYKLLRFENRELNINGVAGNSTIVAVIEQSMKGSYVAQHEVAIGIGPIGSKSWSLQDGKKRLTLVTQLVAHH